MMPLAWMGLSLGLLAYGVATAWGWLKAPIIAQHPHLHANLLLLTCGIWLELVFFDLMPASQTTLLGILGYHGATLFSLVLFFTPIILMAGLHSFVGWQPQGHLRLVGFCGQNILEGVLIYSLCRVNPWLGTAYLLLTTPHASVEALTVRQLIPKASSGTWLWLVGANVLGLGLGVVLIEGLGSLMSLAVFNQLMAGYLCYVCLVDLYPLVIRQAPRPAIPYTLFAGMALMGLLHLLI